jgi:hypothetical protein
MRDLYALYASSSDSEADEAAEESGSLSKNGLTTTTTTTQRAALEAALAEAVPNTVSGVVSHESDDVLAAALGSMSLTVRSAAVAASSASSVVAASATARATASEAEPAPAPVAPAPASRPPLRAMDSAATNARQGERMGERPRSAEGALATGRNGIVTKGLTKGLGPPAVARASSAPAVIVYE